MDDGLRSIGDILESCGVASPPMTVEDVVCAAIDVTLYAPHESAAYCRAQTVIETIACKRRPAQLMERAIMRDHAEWTPQTGGAAA